MTIKATNKKNMIRFKRNLDTSKGFVKAGTVTDVFPPAIEKGYVEKGWADNYELPPATFKIRGEDLVNILKKEEKAERATKELKTEVVTKKRGRKPKE